MMFTPFDRAFSQAMKRSPKVQKREAFELLRDAIDGAQGNPNITLTDRQVIDLLAFFQPPQAKVAKTAIDYVGRAVARDGGHAAKPRAYPL